MELYGYICPACDHIFDQAVADWIELIDGTCPSSCDDQFVIKVRCPKCGIAAWAKTIPQSYATWQEWPEWVQISDSRKPLVLLPEDDNDKSDGSLELERDGEFLILKRYDDDKGWLAIARIIQPEVGG